MEKPLVSKNNGCAALAAVPVLPYSDFRKTLSALLNGPARHCVTYHALMRGDRLTFLAAVADDTDGTLGLLSHELPAGAPRVLDSLTQEHFALHVFEREMAENFGLEFSGHPWPKPLRAPKNYPFYSIGSGQLHEVGVGPIHAGVIEPGHFRFICHGETVLHLEIALGYQHRGAEGLMVEKASLHQKTLLSECVAGDTALGHGLAFVETWEALCGVAVPARLRAERAIALEIERIAMHVGDLAALCTDVAYQLGAAVLGALRTPVINFLQSWCGNRFGRGLLRAGGTRHPLSEGLREKLNALLLELEGRFVPMARKMFHLPSVVTRLDDIGTVSLLQARLTGAVGPAARASGVARDVRKSHPFAAYRDFPYAPEIRAKGDLFARAILRKKEVEKSIGLIREILSRRDFFSSDAPLPAEEGSLSPAKDAFALSLVEGWRGEICHCAVTGGDGRLIHYKVKDPSLHNWTALSLALRNLEISDFPVNNKSFNLSYCGHDL